MNWLAVFLGCIILLAAMLKFSTSKDPAEEMENKIKEQRKRFDERFNPDFRQRAYDERDIHN